MGHDLFQEFKNEREREGVVNIPTEKKKRKNFQLLRKEMKYNTLTGDDESKKKSIQQLFRTTNSINYTFFSEFFLVV